MQSEHTSDEIPAKKNNNQITMFVLALIFSCLVCFVLLFDPAGLKSLLTSFDLQLNGVTVTGVVSEARAIPSGNPAYGIYKYELTVKFEVDGTTYNTVSKIYYPPLDHDWAGEPMEVIYNPSDPNTAMINNFNERWMAPITEALPR
ncbi:MAG TPA: DUF3592 domain-containing protein [Anaerolineales bacterium]|nr:DUF3592 domain-containing protein [Anaerolineales bacterium]HNC08778.1 DUF3592 domain-containing protein [Anaerolineales bacterium]